jgi:hypothetical protein
MTASCMQTAMHSESLRAVAGETRRRGLNRHQKPWLLPATSCDTPAAPIFTGQDSNLQHGLHTHKKNTPTQQQPR